MKKPAGSLFFEIILINSVILQVLVSTISNYSTVSFILKALSFIIVFVLIIIDIKANSINSKELFASRINKKFYFTLAGLIFLPALSLLYSANPYFGFQKITTLIISTIPPVLAISYLLLTRGENKLLITITSLQVLTTLLIISGLVINPFSPQTSYSFQIDRWSHVLAGRLEGVVFIITLLLWIHEKNKMRLIIYAVLLILFAYGISITGLRSSLLGIIFFAPVIISWYLYTKRIDQKRFSATIIIAAITIIMCIIFPSSNRKITERYESMADVENMRFGEDGAIHSRLDAMKISYVMFKERPILGWGFGGFRNYYFKQAGYDIKYPHNIFIEFTVELGIVGLIFFLWLLYLIISSVKLSSALVFIFLFTVWLALFSKDIPSNTMLWIWLAFIPKTKSNQENRE